MHKGMRRQHGRMQEQGGAHWRVGLFWRRGERMIRWGPISSSSTSAGMAAHASVKLTVLT